jgi:hypothetical protein
MARGKTHIQNTQNKLLIYNDLERMKQIAKFQSSMGGGWLGTKNPADGGVLGGV